MAIEWLVISAALAPHIKKYVADRAEKLAAKSADNVLLRIYRRLIPEEKIARANEAFVVQFAHELNSAMDLATLEAESYQEALKTFLGNPSVQDALLAPLDAQSKLDWELLRGFWGELRAPRGEGVAVLPANFAWASVANNFEQSIRKQMLADPELRPVVEAIASLRTAEGTDQIVGDMRRLVGPARAFDLTRYVAATRTAYRHLRLAAIDSDWTRYEQRVRLEAVYVPQSVKQALPARDLTRDYLLKLNMEHRGYGVCSDEDELQRWKEEYAQTITQPVTDVVNDPQNSRLVILGDPGLGKSALLEHMALRWAANPEGPLTVLIHLRQAARDPAYISFLDFLEKAPHHTCPLPRKELDDHLKNHASLFMFDGLDEVPQGRRSETVSSIIRFAEDSPQARIIVTTRIYGYHPGSTHPERFLDAQFQQFTLQDFDDSEIDAFIHKWHQEAFSNISERERCELRVRKAIDDSSAIHELAANPLLLTLMAMLSRSQDLPRDRGKLYERCAEMLLENWDFEKFPELKERRETRDIRDKLGPDQKMRILEQVAVAMQEERTGLVGNLIAEDKLKQVLERELAQLEVAQPWDGAHRLIQTLRERNFMLAHLGDRQYAFIHRTFLEYFCARDLKYRLARNAIPTIDSLLEVFRTRWDQDEWHEILRLVCAQIGAEDAGKCALELSGQPTRPPKGFFDAVFLAAQCLQEVREPGLIQEARNHVRQLLLSLTSFDVPWFYQEWDREGQEIPRIRSRAVRELARGWRDDPGTITWLKDRAVACDELVSVRFAAIEEFARGWKHDPDTRVWLKDYAICNDHLSVRSPAVRELVHGWKGDLEILRLLKDRAVHDGDQNVRCAAVEGLVPGWKDASETLPWLRDRTVNDEHNDVRQLALDALVRGWKKDPSILSLVKERAASDTDPHVRQAALRQLAHYWKLDPETLPLLKERAARGDDPKVRSAALDELARGWKRDPETLLLLKDRAERDDPAVRDTAIRWLATAWKHDPDTLPFLKKLAICGEDVVQPPGMHLIVSDLTFDFRQTAIEYVAYGWQNDAETLPWLKELARGTKRWEVRQAAAKQLALHWARDPEVLELLKALGTSDDNPRVRLSAVIGTARGWSGDAEILGWLKERVALDGHPNVRQEALHRIVRGWYSEADTLPWLKERLAHDDHPDIRQAACVALSRGWGEDADVFAWLREHAIRDADQNVCRVAVEELVRRRKRDPGSLKWLKDLAMCEDNYHVRWAAVFEVSKWKSDPETVAWLKYCAVHNSEPAVRHAALSAVALGWKEDPGTRVWIKECAAHGEPFDVRLSAVLQLALVWKDDPDTLRWLRECAIRNDHPGIRCWALHHVASNCKSEPETVALLKDRAAHDENPEVRQRAVEHLIGGWKDNPEIEQFLANLGNAEA